MTSLMGALWDSFLSGLVGRLGFFFFFFGVDDNCTDKCFKYVIFFIFSYLFHDIFTTCLRSISMMFFN